MKNPFNFFKKGKKPDDPNIAPNETKAPEVGSKTAEEISPLTERESPEMPAKEEDAPDDGFTEWLRSRVHGGIERRERNDIFEEYSVYGVDKNGSLTCRRYHRYPEHEREFGLSYSRSLTFDEFNRRLLSQLDRGDIKLEEYNECINMADQVSHTPAEGKETAYSGFSGSELAALRDFCEELDTLKDKNYLSGDGIFRCECASVVGGDALCLWFRKPLPHDALYGELSGVAKEKIDGFEIENLWSMGVFNRLNERCSRCTVYRLSSTWSIEKESILLFCADGSHMSEDTLLVAVGDPADLRKFGFFSLDFSSK